MHFKLRNRHLFAIDIALLPIAVYLSFVLRVEERTLAGYGSAFALFTVLALLIVPLAFRLAGVYSRYWQFASVEEMTLLAGAITLATIVVAGLSFATGSFAPDIPQLPRSIPFIFLLLALVCTAAPRLAIRFASQRPYRRTDEESRPVLIMGAGDAGRMMVRELQRNAQLGMQPVGFVDDDPSKQGMRIHGVRVLGNRHDIPRLAQKYAIARIIIAIPTAPGKTIREIVAICEDAGVQAKTMPGMYELLDGKVSVNQLRDVQIQDLLRREPVQADQTAIANLVHGKRVLVTGGGGSIGSELCRQLLRCGPSELMGHGENSVFEIQNELQRALAKNGSGTATTRVSAVIADIRFDERIRNVFQQVQPEIVFHAAAHKHVPLMELYPEEAVTNNVLGTRNVLDAALAADVERFVMISSDKAVNPTSVMGVSKRVAELLVHRAAEQSGKPYVAVRFGNVLGSRGSVALTFRQQIAAGGPVTITDAEMTRYFMTIPEAVTLVLQAAVLGRGGEVFVLDMGDPVKIMDLARDMIELSGLQVGHDIDIVCTGRRPGEKLFEELFVKGEQHVRTTHEKIFHACNAGSFVPARLDAQIAELAAAAQACDKAAIRRCFQELVPQYQPMQAQESQAPQTVKVEVSEPIFDLAPLPRNNRREARVRVSR